MILRPLNDRVLIKPHVAPTETPSGLQLVEHYKPEQTGTVVAVGIQVHPLKPEADVVCDEIDACEGWTLAVKDASRLLRQATAREPVVKAGDEVLFSWQAGQEIFLHDDDERYLLLREDDLLAVIED